MVIAVRAVLVAIYQLQPSATHPIPFILEYVACCTSLQTPPHPSGSTSCTSCTQTSSPCSASADATRSRGGSLRSRTISGLDGDKRAVRGYLFGRIRGTVEGREGDVYTAWCSDRDLCVEDVFAGDSMSISCLLLSRVGDRESMDIPHFHGRKVSEVNSQVTQRMRPVDSMIPQQSSDFPDVELMIDVLLN